MPSFATSFAALAALTGVGALIISALFWFVESGPKPDRVSKGFLYTLLGCFALGLGLQRLLVGPQFVRFHLSDLGFPVTGVVYLWALQWMFKRLRTQPTSAGHLRQIIWERRVIAAYGVFAFALEVYAAATRLNNARFDWTDVAMYATGTALACGALTWEIATLRNAHPAP